VWGLEDTKTNYIRVFMVAIRKKLEPDPSHPRYFVTEPGSGLRFVPEGVLTSPDEGT
jgi:two-component system KDP operon response regulator KdpE